MLSSPIHWSKGLLHGVDHPENFPVASILLPRPIRQSVLAIYAVARFADDLADEGTWQVGQRLAFLREFHGMLQGEAPGPWMTQAGLDSRASRCVAAWLAQALHQQPQVRTEMSLMLSAFAWDARGFWPQTAEQFESYCRGSAASVGRMLLALHQVDSPDNLRDADAICIALQRINMLQDSRIDAMRGRIYVPADALYAMGYDAQQWFDFCSMGSLPGKLRLWVRNQAIDQLEALRQHQRLVSRMPMRLALELKAIIAAAATVALMLCESPDPVRERPKLQGALTAIGIFRLLRHWLFGLPLKSADRPRPDACQPSQKTKQGEPT
ncbi:MAG: squalene/phytoene synthase family protein [Proteobacteria bacterium]|nr:squalene/phytoene synthase family protein [Pseudomonadota bacterium]